MAVVVSGFSWLEEAVEPVRTEILEIFNISGVRGVRGVRHNLRIICSWMVSRAVCTLAMAVPRATTSV